MQAYRGLHETELPIQCVEWEYRVGSHDECNGGLNTCITRGKETTLAMEPFYTLMLIRLA